MECFKASPVALLIKEKAGHPSSSFTLVLYFSSLYQCWYSLVGSEGARMTWPPRMVREKLGLALVKTLTVGLLERTPVLTWWLK